MLVGPPGCGKTKELLVEMTSVAGRYMFALPTTDLIGEALVGLRREAALSGTEPVIRAIHSKVAGRAPAGVAREIADAIQELSSLRHAILVVTHEGLMATDLSCAAAAPWHARIDEVPSATVAGGFRAPASSRFFQAAYDLAPVEGTAWHRVSPKADAPSPADILADDLVGGLAAFHKRSRSPQGVFVDVADWRDARDRERTVRWWSSWTPAELAPFATATIAASGFFHSLTCLAARKWSGTEVEFVRREVGGGQASTRKPTVRVRYFTRGHRASTEWWFPSGSGKGREGKRCLAAVSRHLEGVDGLGYWSGNEGVVSYFEGCVPGEQVRPKVAGSNLYRRQTSCALIYSSKARPEDAILLDVFGLTREEVERAREREDIWQFAMRGAVREAGFDGLYTVYVYDLWQAEALAAMLREAGVADEVSVEPVAEAGILDVQRPKPGPKPGAKAAASGRSFEQREAERREGDRLRKQRQREKERVEKAAAGTLRGRGRPRKPDGGEASP
ncbi:hypothetical protein GCM10009416_14340 [Craurococcus roseus]|uniref:Uncharacterized protein n=1 Tax=Craurococcus roseus TaxID=77585 RepID=A0ABN1EX95_9PROT